MFFGGRRDPVGACDTIGDDFVQCFDGGFDVGLEEAAVDLDEGVGDGSVFVGQGDGEGGFEGGDKVGDAVGAEVS